MKIHTSLKTQRKHPSLPLHHPKEKRHAPLRQCFCLPRYEAPAPTHPEANHTAPFSKSLFMIKFTSVCSQTKLI